MTDEEIKSLAETECKKLLKSEKGYNGISFQEFWEEGAKWGMETICKKILEEVKVKNLYLSFGNKINYFALEELMKNLGVEV